MTDTLLAVAGGKGGCGKTTTTLGLARAAADRTVGRPAPGTTFAALAVDADVEMPNLHRVAGVDRDPGLDDGPPAEVARPAPDAPGVGVVAAPDGELQPAALSRCRQAAPLTVVDCPAGAGRDAARPLRVVDAAVLVTTLSPACLRDTARTAAMARALGTSVAGTVVSRADRAPDELESLLSTPTVATVPAVSAPLAAPDARAAYESALTELLARERDT